MVAIYQKAVGEAATVTLDENNCVQISITEGADISGNHAIKELSKVIDSESTTMMTVERDSKVLIGDIETATIDIGDLERLGSDGPSTDVGALFHETTEQYFKQVDKSSNASSHRKALNVEGRITGYIMTLEYDRFIDFDKNIIEGTCLDNNTKKPIKYTINFDSNNNVKSNQ